jgi:NAD(P)H dehydrogenase (quinone)
MLEADDHAGEVPVILVTGATGSIGRHLVRHLSDGRVPFRAFVRDQAKGEALGCEFITGDFDDPGSVTAAMDGIDRVFLNAAGAGPATGPQPMIRQQHAVIDAARRAGVSTVVKVSVWGARPDGRLAQSAHWQIEQHLKASGIGWSVLQPSGFMQNFLTGVASFTAEGDLLGAYGDGHVSYIDCADIAACAAVLLKDGHGTRGTFVLTGPESLTLSEIAGKLSRAWGRPVRYADLSPARMAAAIRAQGLPGQFADDIAVLCEEVAKDTLAATTTTVRDLTGRDPRTFDEFLAGMSDAPDGLTVIWAGPDGEDLMIMTCHRGGRRGRLGRPQGLLITGHHQDVAHCRQFQAVRSPAGFT